MLKSLAIINFSPLNNLNKQQLNSFKQSKQYLSQDMFVKSESRISFRETDSPKESPSNSIITNEMLEKALANPIESLETQNLKLDTIQAKRVVAPYPHNSSSEIGTIIANNVSLLSGTHKVNNITTFDHENNTGNVVILGNHTIGNITSPKVKVLNYEDKPDLKASVTSINSNSIFLGGNATDIDRITLSENNAKLEIDSKPTVRFIDFTQSPSSELVISNKSNTEIDGKEPKIVNQKEISDLLSAIESAPLSLSSLTSLLPNLNIKGGSDSGLYTAKLKKQTDAISSNGKIEQVIGTNKMAAKQPLDDSEFFVSSNPISISKLQENLGIEIIGKPTSITTIFRPLKEKEFKTTVYPVID